MKRAELISGASDLSDAIAVDCTDGNYIESISQCRKLLRNLKKADAHRIHEELKKIESERGVRW